MKKFLIYLVLVTVVLIGGLRVSLEFEGMQDTAVQQLAKAAMMRAAQGLPEPDALKVYICGSASPLGNSDRAGACVAILTPSHFYIVDSGAGSTARVMGGGLPTARLQGVLLTHFHSDHIAEVYELNLASWVAGRPTPMRLIGPDGVDDIAEGINETYALDREYRIAHHGADLLPPALGELAPEEIKPDSVFQDGDLTITVYSAAHAPVAPSVGYRFDYRGRSVVVSGDSVVTEATRQISDGTDLVLHDALATPLVTRLAAAALQADLTRISAIMTDVLDYHASTDDLLRLNEQVDIGLLGFYHLVPNPANLVMQEVFERRLPDNVIVVEDGDWFELPAGSTEIRTIRP